MNKIENNFLNNCRIILVNPTHPGNIGSAARAMKNMGLTELYLVSSNINIIDDHAIARSSGADDVLARAKIVSNIKEAIIDCVYLLGTSARGRNLSSPILNPRTAAKIAIENYAACDQKIAIIFGQERIGLTNDELSICHAQIMIPANPNFSSLNIASAVQLICYELNIANLAYADLAANLNNNNNRGDHILATANEIELFYEHLERVMIKTEFLDPKQPKMLMRRLRRLYNRAQMCQQELNIMRGILTACEKSMASDQV